MSRPKGFKHSEETKRKMSASQKGRPLTPEHCEALSRGKLASDKSRGPNAYQWIPDRVEAARRTKVARMCYGLLGRAIEYSGTVKEHRTFEELGYTPDELRAHLESLFQPGMTWENHGKDSPDKWNVDHIRPIISFQAGTPPSVINALSNLRPLWATENLSKGSKWQPQPDL